MLSEGRYHYRASHMGPGLADSIRLEGLLVISASDEESVAGHWVVPELHPELGSGGRETTGYEVRAQPTYFGSLTHRIRPEGQGILCSGHYTWVQDGGIEHTMPVTCSISREVGESPLMPALGPEDPVIRRSDEDTLAPPLLPRDTAGRR